MIRNRRESSNKPTHIAYFGDRARLIWKIGWEKWDRAEVGKRDGNRDNGTLGKRCSDPLHDNSVATFFIGLPNQLISSPDCIAQRSGNSPHMLELWRRHFSNHYKKHFYFIFNNAQYGDQKLN
jgi:hypothetical protein